MRSILPILILSCFFCADIYSQCNGINNNACTTAAPTVIGASISCTPPANQGGRRNFRVQNMVAGATYRISNCGSGYDTQMTIRDASGAFVGFNDDDGPACSGTAASIDFTPAADGTYRIHLNRYDCSTANNLNGDIVVTLLSSPSAPANDDCANATSLAVSSTATCSTSTSGTTENATQSIAAITCNGATGNADDDVWYSFVATATNHDITVTPGTIRNVVVDLRSGSCNGTNIDCANDTGGSSAEVLNATGLTIGTTYYIRVYSNGGTSRAGTFDICVTTPVIGVCQPMTETPDVMYIETVRFLGTLEDVSNVNSGEDEGYQDFTGLPTYARQVEGEGVNVYVEATFRCRFKAWVDWNNDDNFDDATEEVYDTGTVATTTTTFGFVIPLGTVAGDYRIRIRNYTEYDFFFSDYFTSYDFNACENFVNTASLEQYGEAEDYMFTVEPYCDAIVNSVTDGDTCGTGTVDLSVAATGSPSITEYRWYDAETGGNLVATTATGSWTTPSLSSTTTYYVTAYNGSCESWTRTPVTAAFHPIPILTVTPDTPSRYVCGENDMLEITAAGDVDDIFLINEDFETGDLGVFSNIVLTDNGATINNRSAWQNQTSTFIPSEEVWFPAISSGFGSDQFVICNSDVGSYTTQNALQSTTSYDTTDFVNLTLSFDCYYSHYLQDGVGGADDYLAVEVSTDGTNWTAITANIIADVGIGTKFETLSYDMSSYTNEPTLSVRIRFYAIWADGVAVDNIKLFGDQDVTTVDWDTTPAGIVDLYIDTTGDGIGDTPYTSGSYGTVYAMPTLAQLQEASYSFTIDANLTNGCGAASFNFNMMNNTRIFDASVADWEVASNWAQNSVPTADDCVIIMDNGLSTDTTIPTSASGFAKNVTVKNGGYLDLESRSSLTVTDWIHVESGGTINVNDSANLIQITDVATNNNTGNINMHRTATGVTSTDYIYWSSAVENFDVANVSPGTLPFFIYQWQPTVSGNGLGNYGEWQSASGNMGIGNGYIIRGISGTAVANTAEFVGRPNNGIILTTVTRGTYTGADYPGAGSGNATQLDDNWNLIGNPYPSAISADAFIARNASVITDDTNPATITGTVYMWRHLGPPSSGNGDPFYSDYLYNYNADDYIQYNSTGSNPVGFRGNIAAGQAFFVLMDDGAPATSTVEFNNSMRGASYDNDQFYRSTTQSENNVVEKHRIWLDIISPSNVASSTLVGYVTGATNDKDRLFDGDNLSDASTSIYSLINDKKMSIQGRAIPFQDTDEVPLGIKAGQNGTYNIAINSIDGLFEDTEQDIFLEDTYTGTLHNLRLIPYSFYTDTGIFNDRFILKYKQSNTLSTDEYLAEAGVIVYTNNNQIKITSYESPIKQIWVYDMLGKQLVNLKEVDQREYNITSLKPTYSTLIVKVILEGDKQKIQKIVH